MQDSIRQMHNLRDSKSIKKRNCFIIQSAVDVIVNYNTAFIAQLGIILQGDTLYSTFNSINIYIDCKKKVIFAWRLCTFSLKGVGGQDCEVQYLRHYNNYVFNALV